MSDGLPLSLREIRRTFQQGDRKLEVLRGVTLELKAGEIVALVGQSGSGKSTFLRAIAGLDRPSAGELVVNGLDGNDTIDASAITPGQINLVVDGGADNDTIIGSRGADLLIGGDGDDVITGGAGNDKLLGLAGNDRFVWNPGDGSDVVEGGDGADYLYGNGGDSDTGAPLLVVESLDGSPIALNSDGLVSGAPTTIYALGASLDGSDASVAPVWTPEGGGMLAARFGDVGGTPARISTEVTSSHGAARTLTRPLSAPP